MGHICHSGREGVSRLPVIGAFGAAALGLALLLSPLAVSPAAAQPANAEQLCTPDVMRLCSDYIPNRESIIACMIRAKAQLSPGCASVFNTPPPQSERIRTARGPASRVRVARTGSKVVGRKAAAKTRVAAKQGGATKVARNRPLDINTRRR